MFLWEFAFMFKKKVVVILRQFGVGTESASRFFSNYLFYFILELMQASSLVLDTRGLIASSIYVPNSSFSFVLLDIENSEYKPWYVSFRALQKHNSELYRSPRKSLHKLVWMFQKSDEPIMFIFWLYLVHAVK